MDGGKQISPHLGSMIREAYKENYKDLQELI